MDAIGIIRREWDAELSLRRANRGHEFRDGDLAYPVLYANKRTLVRIRRERGTWEGAPAWRYAGSLEGATAGEITLLIELIPQRRRSA